MTEERAERDLCGCIKCMNARIETALSYGVVLMRGPITPGWRYACEICGNKRCPKHQDHRFKCTGSNAAGRIGVLGG